MTSQTWERKNRRTYSTSNDSIVPPSSISIFPSEQTWIICFNQIPTFQSSAMLNISVPIRFPAQKKTVSRFEWLSPWRSILINLCGSEITAVRRKTFPKRMPWTFAPLSLSASDHKATIWLPTPRHQIGFRQIVIIILINYTRDRVRWANDVCYRFKWWVRTHSRHLNQNASKSYCA